MTADHPLTDVALDAVMQALRPGATVAHTPTFCLLVVTIYAEVSEPAPHVFVMEDMWDDIVKLIARHSKTKIDQGNTLLHEEEIQGECLAKLSKAIDKGLFIKLKTRKEFFGYLKVMVRNCINSLVQRHVYTAKRTGNEFRKDKNGKIIDYKKASQVSLNDDDSDIQVGDYDAASFAMDKEYLDAARGLLTPAESMVFDQLLEPNLESLIYAQIASFEKNRRTAVKIRVQYKHMAMGLGVSTEVFGELLETIKTKVKSFMNHEKDGMESEEQKVFDAEVRLCVAFKTQLPPTIPPAVRRRMFTLVARDNQSTLTDEVYADLEIVGAIIPKKLGEETSCFGVLWHRNHRACRTCGLVEGCKEKAMNVALGDLTISPRLLSRLMRTPAILPVDPPSEVEMNRTTEDLDVVADSERDITILGFLGDNFKRVTQGDQVFFRQKEATMTTTKRRVPPFHVGQRGRTMALRFCNPDVSLKDELVTSRRQWLLPPDCSADDAIALINRHASIAFD